MEVPNFDDKDLAIVSVLLIAIVAMSVMAWTKMGDITSVVTHSVTCLGSLAIGRKLQ